MKAKNSHSKRSRKKEAKKKQQIKLITEWAVFCIIITIEELKSNPIKEKVKSAFNGKLIIVNERGDWTHDIWFMIPMFYQLNYFIFSSYTFPYSYLVTTSSKLLTLFWVYFYVDFQIELTLCMWRAVCARLVYLFTATMLICDY